MTTLEQFINEGREKDRKALETSIKEMNNIISRLNRHGFLTEANDLARVRRVVTNRLNELP